MKALLRMNYYLIGGHITALILIAFPFLTLMLPFSGKADAINCLILSAIFGFAIGIVTNTVDNTVLQSRWRSYAKTLPYTREQLVDAKYLFSLLIAAAAAFLSTVILPLLLLKTPAALSELTYAPSAAELSLMNAALTAALALQMAAFQNDLYFHRAGGILILIVQLILGFPFFILFFFAFVYLCQHLDWCKWEPLTLLARCLPYLLLAVSAVCYLFSWVYTRKTYCRRRKRRRAA